MRNKEFRGFSQRSVTLVCDFLSLGRDLNDFSPLFQEIMCFHFLEMVKKKKVLAFIKLKF